MLNQPYKKRPGLVKRPGLSVDELLLAYNSNYNILVNIVKQLWLQTFYTIEAQP